MKTFYTLKTHGPLNPGTHDVVVTGVEISHNSISVSLSLSQTAREAFDAQLRGVLANEALSCREALLSLPLEAEVIDEDIVVVLKPGRRGTVGCVYIDRQAGVYEFNNETVQLEDIVAAICEAYHGI